MEKKIREKIIISADDFGMDEKANAGILALLEEGKLDRVSVLACGIFSDAEISRLIGSRVKVDLHLDLPDGGKSEGLARGGVWVRLAGFISGYFFGKNRAKLIAAEWERQVEKFQKIFGRIPDGLNSHQYIHFFPPYFCAAVGLAQKYGVPFLRFGSRGLIDLPDPVCFILKILHWWNFGKFRSSGLVSTDFLVGLDWLKNPERFLDNLPGGKTELVCHPRREAEREIINRCL